MFFPYYTACWFPLIWYFLLPDYICTSLLISNELNQFLTLSPLILSQMWPVCPAYILPNSIYEFKFSLDTKRWTSRQSRTSEKHIEKMRYLDALIINHLIIYQWTNYQTKLFVEVAALLWKFLSTAKIWWYSIKVLILDNSNSYLFRPY